MKKNNGSWYLGIGFLVGIVVFAGVWLYALATWGLLFGLIFGWIPGLIAGFISFWVWPLFILAALFIWWEVTPHTQQVQNTQQTQNYTRINVDCTKKQNSFSYIPSLSFSSLTDFRFTAQEDEDVKKFCEYGWASGYFKGFPVVSTKNYRVRLYTNSVGNLNNDISVVEQQQKDMETSLANCKLAAGTDKIAVNDCIQTYLKETGY